MRIARAPSAPRDAHARRSGPPRRVASRLLAGTGAAALLAGVLLLLAPVEQSVVEVGWPVEGEPTESTVLLLANQTPHALDVAFTGDAALEAADADGVVLQTVDPAAGESVGLSVTSTAGELTVALGDGADSWPVRAGESWRVSSSIHGLIVTRDDAVVAEWTEIAPPQIDALLTSVPHATGADLSARLHVVDDADSRPTALKIALTALGALFLIGALVLLIADDRSRGASEPSFPRPGLRRRLVALARRASVADFVAIGLLSLWIFIGPMTDDDGYYAVMSLNAAEAGYVGNYFQMFNQGFTPFTWLWQFFDVWQAWGGRSPVWLRVPALAAAIVAWFVTRSLLEPVLSRGRLHAEASRVLLALVFFVWWAAYAIGARPEPFVATATVVVISLLLRAHRRHTLAPAAVAVAVAASSFAVHPVGLVASAPLILAIPTLWSIARDGASLSRAWARTTAVASASAVALILGFADGSLSGMLVGQRRFALVETPLNWTDEVRRYLLLLADAPMGGYARRSVVLVTLVLLIWFVVYVVWSRRVAPFSRPVPVSLVGWSVALSFAMIWITPSKWTHHFGALAAIGPLFIVIAVAVLPRLVGEMLGDAGRLPRWLAPFATLSLVPAMVLALRGPDSWAYEWGVNLQRGPYGPEVLGVSLSNVYLWALIAAGCVAGGALLSRRLRGSVRSAPALAGCAAVVAVFFVMTSGYLLASFVRIALPTHEGFTLGQSTLADPAGDSCLPDESIGLWDAASGTPWGAEFRAEGFLTPAAGEPRPPSAASSLRLWSSAGSPAGTGILESEWLAIPPLEVDQRIVLLATGDLTDGRVGSVTAEFRSAGSTAPDPEGAVVVRDSAVRSGWTSLMIAVPEPYASQAGASMRIVVEDRSAVPGDAIIVSEPVIADRTTLRDAGGAELPTAVGWMQTFWFPCQRPMTIARGIIEPPVLATTFGPNGVENIWLPLRGGSLAGVERIARINTPATALGDSGTDAWGRVHLFEYGIATEAYSVDQRWVQTWGWRSALDPASQLHFH